MSEDILIEIGTSYWYNFKTGEYDAFGAEIPKDFKEYIPQGQEEQGMYFALIQLNHTPLEAAKQVLMACEARGVSVLAPIEIGDGDYA